MSRGAAGVAGIPSGGSAIAAGAGGPLVAVVLHAYSAVTLWLAFFPPKSYQAWIEHSQKPEPGHG